VNVGGVTNELKEQTSFNETVAYEPANGTFLNSPIFGEAWSPAYFIFDPTLLAQFDEANGNKNTLQFNGKDQSVRLGPQLMLSMFPNKLNRMFYPNEQFASVVSNLSFSVSYHPYYEMVSRRSLSLFTVNAKYNLDSDGHVALAASYQKGSDEDTGMPVNLVKVSLTGKL
jgi:hypothetical protein